MNDTIQEFKDGSGNPVAVDMKDVIAVGIRDDYVVLHMTNEDRPDKSSLYIKTSYAEVVEAWHKAKQTTTLSQTHLSDIRELIESVRNLAVAESNREQQLIEMHSCVRNLSEQVSRLTDAVSSMKLGK